MDRLRYYNDESTGEWEGKVFLSETVGLKRGPDPYHW